MRTINLLILITLCLHTTYSKAQIKTYWIDTTTYSSRDNAYFFTNRPKKINDDGSVNFKNKFTQQTNNLYFCLFNYDKDSIYLKFRAENTSNKYPTEKVEDNFFYGIFDHFYYTKGIRNFYIVIPGYSKTFKDQIYDYIHRLKEIYGDTLSEHSVIFTYAWGNEWRPEFYYRAKRSARKAGNDFAIFEHMVEEFITDTAYLTEHPREISIKLLCTSMGNQLLKKYLLQREEYGIPLVRTYDKITFIGSDASYDSFEEGKGFHNIHQLTDSVNVFVNKKDKPLTMSQKMNQKPRLGLVGPKHSDKLPGYIKIYDITSLISIQDLPALNHDYLLRNPVVKESLIHTLINK